MFLVARGEEAGIGFTRRREGATRPSGRESRHNHPAPITQSLPSLFGASISNQDNLEQITNMANRSRIEWTELTWNPVTGCTKLSPGCAYCYAEPFAERLKAMGIPGYRDGFAVTLHPDRLEQPLRRHKPTRWFVNSMSDLFHDAVPDDFIDLVFSTIERARSHQFQILTKRPERAARYFAHRVVPTNSWLGVSVENRRHGLPRIELLRKIPASLRFLSVEPLLEDLGDLSLDGIHWVIVGGESGPHARGMKPEWARRVRDTCVDSDVPFFFKQWGSLGEDGLKRSKKANGRLLDGRIWDEMPS